MWPKEFNELKFDNIIEHIQNNKYKKLATYLKVAQFCENFISAHLLLINWLLFDGTSTQKNKFVPEGNRLMMNNKMQRQEKRHLLLILNTLLLTS